MLALLLLVSAVSGANLFCPVCEDGIMEAESVLSSNATAEEIEKVLHDVCKKLPSSERSKCISAVNKLVPQLNSTDESIMLKYSPRALCAILEVCELECCATPFTPEQIHLAFTGDDTSMTVSWVTLEETPDSTVRYGRTSAYSMRGEGKWEFSSTGQQHVYSSGGWRGVIHTAVMTNLKPGERYYYIVGSHGAPTFWNKPNWSLEPAMHFNMTPSHAPSVTFAMTGDMGAMANGDRTRWYLQQMVEDREVDFVFHSGDIGYADGYQSIWDIFMRKTEPIAGYAPYMTIPGNHEGYFNFHAYAARFLMPSEASGSTSPLYYSFNRGSVHFVCICTEGPDGLIPFGFSPETDQYKWLEKDLAVAHANRATTPWIVVIGHRPLYCAAHSSECTKEAALLREGLEPLFAEYKVDVYSTAHVHNYQRMYPIINSTRQGSYINPTAPVHILNGAGGNKELLSDGLMHPRPDWLAYSNVDDYGYGVWQINATHMKHEYRASANGTVLDVFYIVKT